MKNSDVNKANKDIKLLTGKLKTQEKSNAELQEKLNNCQTKFKEEVKLAARKHKQTQTFAYLIFIQHEEEKKKISRELHDEIAQLLTGISYELSILSRETKNVQPDIHKKILHTQELIEKSVEVVHRFARELRPIILDDLGLVAGFKSYAKEFSRISEMNVRLRIQKKFIKVNDIQKIVLFRVVQESLSNVSKHSKATKVIITLKVVKNYVLLDIQDNGVSFNVLKTTKGLNFNRLGLLGMQERVKLVHGKLSIISSSSTGTLISAKIPLL